VMTSNFWPALPSHTATVTGISCMALVSDRFRGGNGRAYVLAEVARAGVDVEALAVARLN
jgi:hypothetical protein